MRRVVRRLGRPWGRVKGGNDADVLVPFFSLYRVYLERVLILTVRPSVATTFVCKLPVVLPGTEHDSFVAILVSDVSVNRMMSSRLAASGHRRDDDILGKSENVAVHHQRQGFRRR